MQITTHVRFVFSHDRYQRAIKQFQKALQSFTHPYLIVADLDGTLLNQQGIITAPSQKVLTLLQEAGHVVCLATGRPWRAAKGHYYQLGLKTLITTLNGAVIHDPFYPHNELKFMFSIKLLKDLIADGEIIAIINNILVEDGQKMHFLNPPTKQELIDLGTWLHLNFIEDQPMIGFQDLFANQNCINGLLIQISTNVDIDKIISLIKNKFHTLNCQF